jgi:hypothetical protein
MMHAGLVGVIRTILGDVGIPDMAMVTEAKDLRTIYATRLGNLVVLDFFANKKHLVIDATIKNVFRNSTLQRLAYILGYGAKQTEDKKSRPT